MRKFKGSFDEGMWVLLGVLLLMGVMATFSPNSSFAKVFQGVRGSFESLFGAGSGYCPFINPYALALFSAGDLVVTGDHALCDALEYAAGSEIWSETEAGVVDGKEKIFSGWPFDNNGNYNTDYANGACDKNSEFSFSLTEEGNIKMRVRGDDGNDVEGYASSDRFFARLAAFEKDMGDLLPKDDRIAVGLLLEKRPRWQCFLIFGLLPFLILYHLLNDILMFAFIRTNTRRLVAIFASLLTVMSGALANIIVAVSSFVGISTGYMFLMMIFGIALLSMFIGQFTVAAGAFKSTTEAVQDAVTAALMMKAMSRASRGGGEGE